jgi:hypothetical protein
VFALIVDRASLQSQPLLTTGFTLAAWHGLIPTSACVLQQASLYWSKG